jgi:hypothetical protein
MLIRGMRRVGLAWDVVEIAPERQQQKLMQQPAREPSRVAEPVS